MTMRHYPEKAFALEFGGRHRIPIDLVITSQTLTLGVSQN